MKYEIFHTFKGIEIFDGYALTKLGANYYAKQIFFEQFIIDDDKLTKDQLEEEKRLWM